MVSMYRLKRLYVVWRTRRACRGMGSLTGTLMGFVTIAVIGLAMGIVFGTIGLINHSLNGTLTIPKTFSNAMGTLQNLGGTGLIIAAAVLIIVIIFVLVRIFSGGSE